MKMRRNAITLMELIISLVLLSLIVLAISRIDFFSVAQLISSDEKTKLQNEVAYVLEHMTKELKNAIGNKGSGTVVITSDCVKVKVDSNHNGKFDSSLDGEIKYCWDNNNYTLSFTPAGSATAETIAQRISTFDIAAWDGTENYINAEVTACWEPSSASPADGTPENPCVSMNANIAMPAVSTN